MVQARLIFRFLLGLMATAAMMACNFRVTNERPSYAELNSEEKSAVDTIFLELQALDKQIQERTSYSITNIVDKEKIDVSFQNLIFSANFGDEIVHISTWENVGFRRQQIVAGWFKQAEGPAKQTYRNIFYKFFAVSQGVKQFMYNTLTPEWVMNNRSLFNFERDSVRTALAHFRAENREQEMWTLLTESCKPVLDQYADDYAVNYNKQYFKEHAVEMVNAENPGGYMYFICRFIEEGSTKAGDLTFELTWLSELNK